VTDDTYCAAAGDVLHLDAGTCCVTSMLFIPAGSKMVGEGYAVIISSGSYFNNMASLQPVV
jgi:glucan 1,3-beta-glucosidase